MGCGVGHHPSGPRRTSRVIPALFNPSHVGCGGLRKLQWDVPTSGVEFDGGEFGFWGLPAAPHEQSLRCDPTWPRSGEQLPSPHTLWGAQGGQHSPLVDLWGRECVGTFPSQPAEPDSALGRGGRSCQTPPRGAEQHREAFLDPKKAAVNFHLLVATAKIPEGGCWERRSSVGMSGNTGEDRGAEPRSRWLQEPWQEPAQPCPSVDQQLPVSFNKLQFVPSPKPCSCRSGWQ